VGAKIERTMDDALGAAVKYFCMKLGIRTENLPDKYMIQIIVDDIRQNHGTLFFKELKIAADLATALKLDFDPRTYQNFSPLYVNELLNAYKKWSSMTHKYLRPDGDINAETDKPDWSYKIYRRLPGGVLRGEIQQGYENFLRGILTDRRYIPYEWWAQLVLDGYIEHDDDATVFENVRVNQLEPDQKRKLGNGQQMVWLLFELAKKMGTRDIYVRS
jgi:hypothetical protein